jgi:hypothetical protein
MPDFKHHSDVPNSDGISLLYNETFVIKNYKLLKKIVPHFYDKSVKYSNSALYLRTQNSYIYEILSDYGMTSK